MAPELIYPRPRLFLFLCFSSLIFYPLRLNCWYPLKGSLFQTHRRMHLPMSWILIPLERTQFPYLSWTFHPQMPWFTGKLHYSSTLFVRCLLSRDCIHHLNWFISWYRSSLWALPLYSCRRRACPILSETRWFSLQISKLRTSLMEIWMSLRQTWATNQPSNPPG